MTEPVYHAKAQCRWCGGRFQRYFHHWICEREPCQQRQFAKSVLKSETPTDNTSPYLYIALPFQVECEERQRIVKRLLIHGEAGISKSYFARWSLYGFCREFKGVQVVIVRETLPELYLNHLQFMERDTTLLGDCEFKPDPKARRVEFENSSTCHFRFCQDEGDFRLWRGGEFDRVVVDEAVNFIPKALRLIVSRDRGSEPGREAMYADGREEGSSMLLTNPLGRAEIFLTDTYINRNPDPKEYPNYNPKWYGDIRGDARDNPYLSATHKDSTMGGLNREEYAALAEGEWGVVENQFFNWWEPARG
jgi:hypothetical protein